MWQQKPKTPPRSSYEIWKALGKPDGEFYGWEARRWLELHGGPWEHPFLRDCWIDHHRDEFLRWLNKKYPE